MRLIKKVFKILIYLVLIVILAGGIGYAYIRTNWSSFISENELTDFVTKIKYAEELPDRFYELYEEEYPEVLSKNLNSQLTHTFISGEFVKSPSILAASISDFGRRDSDSLRVSNRKVYSLAWKLEEETTQKECLNWVVNNYKFGYSIHGINDVAAFYYHKQVSELSDQELINVISLMKRPSVTKIIDKSLLRLPE